MGRILAIDYGSKRSGIAVTDESKIIASGLTTVATSQLQQWIEDYVKEEEVETLIIGEPKRMHGVASDIETFIKPFIVKLKQVLPYLKIERIDERFTSKMAFDMLLQSGASKKKRKDKKLIDQISATIILQDYLNYKK
ncbi:Holliday junction resolvase RuvX [Aquimarina sp. ERC-38]|uniref:Holliday junction resolvase RuvX n=1 Tax=Aquimarina sp. ERC-38 TaxID=2949996 RepID=UPI002245DB2E|nr:Holliday junction resolvase RuvX [Aquimarina sp. ERC-38]UZO82699.1 Holliday junction resolvase RuvX [Aquimarina sp. ERC-38]